MPAPNVRWDSAIGRFRSAQGQLISAVRVRQELDRSLLQTSQRVRAIGNDLRAGRTSLAAWRQAMKDEIKSAHLRSAALARGGWDRMDQPAFGRVGQIVRREYQFLESWVGEIKQGAPLDGRLSSRGQLYTQAARGTFHQVQAEEMLKRGMDLEKSVLHPAEHCVQCITEAEAGFRPIGEMVPIGARTCGRNCRCTVVYQRNAA